MLEPSFSNLLGNAIKSTQSGEVSVNVAKDDANQQITVECDRHRSGASDPEVMPRVFTKFATKSHYGDRTGL